MTMMFKKVVSSQITSAPTRCVKLLFAAAVLTCALMMSVRSVSGASSRALLPAERIVDVLRRDPGLVLAVKEAILKNAEQQGRILESSELTDSALFRMVADDPSAALIATQEMTRRGYYSGTAATAGARPGAVPVNRRLSEQVQSSPDETDTPTLAAPVSNEPAAAPTIPRPGASADSKSAASIRENSVAISQQDPLDHPSEVNETSPERAAQEVGAFTEKAVFESRPHPYGNVPALDDLYSQTIDSKAVLQRFGSTIFRNGTGNSDGLPMDMPVGPDYVVGPGDGLKIEVWGGISERLQRVVDREGRVALPEVGLVQISGKSLGEVQQAVERALGSQFRDVRADISLSRLRTVRVYVVGDVEKPGAYDISALSTPLNALYAAGGPTLRGSLRTLRHYRGKELVQEVDVYELILHGMRSGMERLEAGDTVLVPPVGGELTVEGMVRRPAVYEIRNEKSVADALALAGGVLATGTMRHIDVERVQAHESRILLSLDLPEGLDQQAIEQKLREFAIQDGDKVRISPIFPYSQKTVYVTGHVFKPGKYPWRDGLRVRDVVSSYSDLLPEPYKRHAEIVRLEAPDYSPKVIGFSLDAALNGEPESNQVLQPFDTVRIYGRFDFEDAPTVRVSGEVRDPGDHRTSGEMRLRDAIYLAGGLTPDALLDDVHVFRRTSDSRFRVLAADLRKVLAGDEVHNILLLPRDQVIVHRNTAKVDPPVVYMRGEVANPGRYPLGEGLTAAELVRLAGGFRRGAYTETADLARFAAQTGAAAVRAETQKVSIGKALAGDPAADVVLRDGDVLSVRQISGWEDLGASVTVRGEVAHPGVYGITRGERLSSLIKRAGGFFEGAYPAAAILQRRQVRELAAKGQNELVERLEAASLQTPHFTANSTAEEQLALTRTMRQQQEQIISNLRKHEPDGRLVIRITDNIQAWENTAEDIELRDDDVLIIPKRPTFVLVSGQVYSPAAINFTPGKNAGWYLSKAGGPTDLANNGAIFVVRADGSVVGQSGGGLFKHDVLGTKLQPGDTVVVPEKVLGGNGFWRSLFSTAQMMSAVAVTAKLISGL